MKSITALIVSPSLYAGLARLTLATLCPFLAISNMNRGASAPPLPRIAISTASLDDVGMSSYRESRLFGASVGERRRLCESKLASARRVLTYDMKSASVSDVAEDV